MSGIRLHGLVIGAYAVLAMVMSWPAITTLHTRFIGQGGDPWQTMWRFEITARSLHQADFLKNEFLGMGVPRLVNLSVWPWLPLHVVFGQPVAYNLVWFISLVLSGYALFLLLRTLLRQSDMSIRFPHAVPFLTGIFYMFLPYHIAHAYGHFGAMQTQWLPLLALLIFLLLERVTFGRLLLFGLLLVIQAWTEHHYFVWFLFFGVLMLLWHWRQIRWSMWTTLALSAVVIGVTYGPTLRLAATNAAQINTTTDQIVRFSADPFSYVVPAAFHPLWGTVSKPLVGDEFGSNITEATHFLGFIPLLLVLFFYQRMPKKQLVFWSTVAGVFFVLSLGPQLHYFGKLTTVYLPYKLLEHLPGFSAIRAVGRASVLVGLAWSVLMGWVLATNLNRRTSLLYVAIALLLEFLFIPMPTTSATVPAVYQAVAKEPGAYLLELPAATNYTDASRSLYASLFNGKQVVGNIALERGSSQDTLTQARSLPAVRQLLFLRQTDFEEQRTDFFQQDLAETLPDVMKYLDTTTILVHTDSLDTEQRIAVQNFLEKRVGLIPQKGDDTLFYALANHTQLPKSDGVFLVRDSGWKSVVFDAKRALTVASFIERAGITLTNMTGAPKTVTLSFTVSATSQSAVTLKEETTQRGETRHLAVTLSPGDTHIDFIGEPNKIVVIENPLLQ